MSAKEYLPSSFCRCISEAYHWGEKVVCVCVWVSVLVLVVAVSSLWREGCFFLSEDKVRGMRGCSPPSTRKAEMACKVAGERPAAEEGRSSVPLPTTTEATAAAAVSGCGGEEEEVVEEVVVEEEKRSDL